MEVDLRWLSRPVRAVEARFWAMFGGVQGSCRLKMKKGLWSCVRARGVVEARSRGSAEAMSVDTGSQEPIAFMCDASSVMGKGVIRMKDAQWCSGGGG